MKLPDPEQFKFKDCTIAGDECWLINPLDMSTKWDDDNARFRSCIVRKSDNYVVSQLYKKFTNFSEQPDFQPWDKSWKIQATRKLDGSLLGVGEYKGQLIHRTRGTIDARQLDNGWEIDVLIEKYPKVFKNNWVLKDHTILMEWTTPNNIICLREHNEPTLTLLGVIENQSGRYWELDLVDQMGKEWDISRPEYYHYNTIEECIQDVEQWTGKEGIVLFSEDHQTLKKIKSSEYCEIHKLATGIKNINQVLDLFMVTDKFINYQEFYNYIETTLDFEIAEKCKDFINQICEAYTYFLNSESFIRSQVDIFVRSLETRKEQAIYLQQQFSGWQLPYAFTYLDGRAIDDKLLRKAMEDTLKL
jgi:hypothetical protein